MSFGGRKKPKLTVVGAAQPRKHEVPNMEEGFGDKISATSFLQVGSVGIYSSLHGPGQHLDDPGH